MRTTRSQTGKTPRKPLNPGFVETPARRRTARKSAYPSFDSASDSATPEPFIKAEEPISESQGSLPDSAHANGHSNGHSNGPSNGHAQPLASKGGRRVKAAPEKATEDIEFGGSLGVTAMMIGFPLLMYYMWIGATYYDGALPLPGRAFSPPHTRSALPAYAPTDALEFFKHLAHLAYEGAFPHAKAWAIYWTFFVVEGTFYLLLPGIYAKGKPLPHEGGRQLEYYCSGVWSWYTTIGLALGLHYYGIFKLDTLVDEFGPLMSVAILSGIIVSIIAYASALYRGATHRMTGYPIYDFFMGAELNPRMFKWLDFKMFFEVRLPWFILFLVSLGAATKQYAQYGYVTPQVAFVLMAHWLYANACCKGEELIVTTWDMYYEKWGFMLIFWNLAGVPLSYCHCTIYLANHDPSEYAWPHWAMALLFTSYLLVYWVWDTCNSQKNMFRARERGHALERKTFPQLPWKEVKNPTTIETQTGDKLLVDGWYGYARKVHYGCDMFFALTWAGITGFKSPFPWFYPVFFTAMIIHRASRDVTRCRERYGKAWQEYEKRVPWLFIPYVF